MASNENLSEIANRQKKLGYQIKKNRSCYIMLAPYFILFFIFTVLPVIISIGLSFTYFNMLEMPRFTGWANYIRLFLEDDIFLIALKNTLLFAVITGPVSYMYASRVQRSMIPKAERLQSTMVRQTVM